jgi:hypothetical protein
MSSGFGYFLKPTDVKKIYENGGQFLTITLETANSEKRQAYVKKGNIL